jgi:hypothetical protein
MTDGGYEGVVHLVGRGLSGGRASFSIVLSKAMFIPGMFGGEAVKIMLTEEEVVASEVQRVLRGPWRD